MKTTSEVTKEPTGDAPGKMTYTAEFSSDMFTEQKKKVEIESEEE